MDELTVTQADRNAAVRLLEAGGQDWQAKEIRLGAADHFPIVQAFARHRTENTSATEPVAWQDIATAPKDGTIIDVWIDGEFPGRRTDVSWRIPTDSEWWVHGGDTIETPDATWHDCFGPLSSCEQPTHWMPLPPAPEAGQ